MTSKRDVQLVRLACRWRWLTAEEGEDCLALSHRLGATVTMEEIIRRRGYLDADALRQLGEAADRAAAPRRAPRPALVAPRGEQTVIRAMDFEALSRSAEQLRRDTEAQPSPRWGGSAELPPRDGTLINELPPWLEAPEAPTAAQPGPLATLLDASAPTYDEPELPFGRRFDEVPAEVTRLEPLPWFAREGLVDDTGPQGLTDEAEPELPSAPVPVVGEEAQERTVLAPIPQDILQRLRDDAPPEAPKPAPGASDRAARWRRTSTPKPVHLAPVASAVPALFFPDDEVSEVDEPTEDQYQSHRPQKAGRASSFGPAERSHPTPRPAGPLRAPGASGPGPAEPSHPSPRPGGPLRASLASGPGPAEPSHPSPRPGGPLRASLASGPGPAEPSHPSPRPGGPLRASLASPSGPGPAEPSPPSPRPGGPLRASLASASGPGPAEPSPPSPRPGGPLSAPHSVATDGGFLAARQATAPLPPLAGTLATRGLTDPGPLGWAEVAPAVDVSSLLEGDLAEALLGPFGPYELERVVARGARSVVYLARPVDGGGAVAVKVLAGGPAENGAFLAARGDALLAAARLGSPHVVRVLDVGRVDARHYVALEYVEGWTLAEKLAFEDAPAPGLAFQWASQVAEGLAAAHAAGLVHGDLSPDRVLIDGAGRARVTGFGFTPLTPRAEDRSAPPEGRGSDRAGDAYGLGCVLLAALTGGAAPSEGLRPAGLSEDARSTLEALLAPDPAARPSDLRALAERLAEAAEGLRAGLAPAPVAPPAWSALLGKTGVVSAALLVTLAVASLGVELGGLGAARIAHLALQGALASAAGLALGTLLLGTLDLIRRGELPLPQSTHWLVQLGEGAGALGAWFAVAGAMLGPLALMNAVVALVGLLVLLSAVFGVVLRRAVARARPDKGVGRILAVLGDPWVQRWRALHGPMLTVVTGLATARFALMAYFAAR